MISLDIEEKDLGTLSEALDLARTYLGNQASGVVPKERFWRLISRSDDYGRLREIVNARAAQGPEERSADAG